MTVCSVCGKPASKTIRALAGRARVLLGKDAACAEHGETVKLDLLRVLAVRRTS